MARFLVFGITVFTRPKSVANNAFLLYARE